MKKRKIAGEWDFDFEFEKLEQKATRSIMKGLKENGYKLDSQDGALLRNELHRHFWSSQTLLVSALNNIDFHLEEFSSGFCRRPREARPDAVVKAVEEAMGTLLVKLAKLGAQRRKLREALTQVKVDHLNKKTKLPMKTHALVENALHETK